MILGNIWQINECKFVNHKNVSSLHFWETSWFRSAVSDSLFIHVCFSFWRFLTLWIFIFLRFQIFISIFLLFHITLLKINCIFTSNDYYKEKTKLPNIATSKPFACLIWRKTTVDLILQHRHHHQHLCKDVTKPGLILLAPLQLFTAM